MYQFFGKYGVHSHLAAVKCLCYRFPIRKTYQFFNIYISLPLTLQQSQQTEYILSYFLHDSILCLGIYMSVSKPSTCFWKRVISGKWRNKMLIHNINLAVHRKSLCCLRLLFFLKTRVIAPFLSLEVPDFSHVSLPPWSQNIL